MKKLGRGLDSLIKKSEPSPPPSKPAQVPGVQRLDPKSIVVNRAQPRHSFHDETIDELAESIRNQGLVQPLLVRSDGAGGFELIAGERRLRACLKLELDQVPVVVRDIASDALLELALVENIQREDLNPVELALAYQDLMRQRSWNQSQLAERVGKKRPSVANSLRILELPEPIRQSMVEGRVTLGHAKVLLSVPEHDDRIAWHDRLLEEGWSVRALEDQIAAPPPDEPMPEVESRPQPPPRTTGAKPPHILEQESFLSEALGTKVSIRERKGRGRITVEFYSPEDYERLRAILAAPGSR